MKKGIAMLLIAVMCISVVGCGQTKSKGSGKAPKITVSDVRETESNEKSSIKKTEEQSESTRISSIDNKLLALLGNDKDKIISEITSESIGAIVENSENGINVSTQTSVQRNSIIESMNNYIKNAISDYENNETATIINYDIKKGFIDIYCVQSDAKDVENLVNKIAGYMGLGQKISDNKTEWGISVIISDSVTKYTITRGMVSSETSFELSEDDWNTVDTSSQIPRNDELPMDSEESNEDVVPQDN